MLLLDGKEPPALDLDTAPWVEMWRKLLENSHRAHGAKWAKENLWLPDDLLLSWALGGPGSRHRGNWGLHPLVLGLEPPLWQHGELAGFVSWTSSWVL